MSKSKIKTMVRFLCLILIMAAPVNTVYAQSASDIESIRGRLASDRQSVVAEAMLLTNEEAEAFWPLNRQ